MQLAKSVAPPSPTLHAAERYGHVGLTGLEIAAGQLLEPGEPILLEPGHDDPRAEIERALTRALLRPPCVISFSGGRDSSALLALAAAIARREGLDPPVALTQRFPDAPATLEDDWQERAIAHIGVADWIRLDHRDDAFDVVGPIARKVLERHGPGHPSNAHFVVPMLEHARGGTIVTGLDGDSLFGGWYWGRAVRVLAGRLRPRPRDVLRVAHLLAPAPVRRAARGHRAGSHLRPPWLSAAAVPEFRRLRAASVQPRRSDRYVGSLLASRHFQLMRRQLDLISSPAEVTMEHPFLDPAVLAAYATWSGRLGRGTRTDVMRALFGDLLSAEALSRSGKARFGDVYLASHTREFGATWDGSGIDPELVDADALRAVIARPNGETRHGVLVQWLWWATRGTGS
jgi:asparagine synthetase B (glutamine-hydrolysing)